jgi:hypothetical protein
MELSCHVHAPDTLPLGSTQIIGGWVGLGAHLEVSRNIKISNLTGDQTPNHPVHSLVTIPTEPTQLQLVTKKLFTFDHLVTAAFFTYFKPAKN